MVCKSCGNPFDTDWRKDPKTPAEFCSRRCSNRRAVTEETRKKIASSLRETPQEFCQECGKLLVKGSLSGFCQEHKPRSTMTNSERVHQWRKRTKLALIDYKGGECERCGYSRCPEALEFHHKDPSQKDFGLSMGNSYSLERMKIEVDKCMLVCANCHREIHVELRQSLSK